MTSPSSPPQPHHYHVTPLPHYTTTSSPLQPHHQCKHAATPSPHHTGPHPHDGLAHCTATLSMHHRPQPSPPADSPCLPPSIPLSPLPSVHSPLTSLIFTPSSLSRNTYSSLPTSTLQSPLQHALPTHPAFFTLSPLPTHRHTHAHTNTPSARPLPLYIHTHALTPLRCPLHILPILFPSHLTQYTLPSHFSTLGRTPSMPNPASPRPPSPPPLRIQP